MGVPKLGKKVAIPGVEAYQDSDDINTWWYVPTYVPLAVGGSLLNFSVTYWGISKFDLSYRFTYKKGKVHPKQDGRESTGAILAGQSIIDITRVTKFF